MVRPRYPENKRRPNVKKGPKPVGPQIEDHHVILRPLITEKGTWQIDNLNAYAFQVNVLATKDVIRRAVENLFKVRVDSVRTINMKGEGRRFRGRPGATKAWKKAIVKLHADDKIPIF